jgi:hypothetical protein
MNIYLTDTTAKTVRSTAKVVENLINNKQKLKRKKRKGKHELLQMPIMRGLSSHEREGSQSTLRCVPAHRQHRVDGANSKAEKTEVVEVSDGDGYGESDADNGNSKSVAYHGN